MCQLTKTLRYSVLCIIFGITFSLLALANGGSSFELEWVAPPPPVVVANIGEVYRIGCRVTLNSSKTYDFDLQDVKLSAEISQYPQVEGVETIIASTQLSEIGVSRQKVDRENGGPSLSKIFEYKPERKDSNNYFCCEARIENSTVVEDSGFHQQFMITEQFRVEYSPIGLEKFDNTQRTGREMIFDAVKGKNFTIDIPFDANPSPSYYQIKWHIVRGTPDLSLILSPGETIHRMSAFPIKVSENAQSGIAVNKHTASLRIENIRYDDGKDFFYLEVTNKYGNAEFRFALNILNEDPNEYEYVYSEALNSDSTEIKHSLLSFIICSSISIFVSHLSKV